MDREYSNAGKIGLDAAAASEHADDFYGKHFGLDPIAPDYSTALVQLGVQTGGLDRSPDGPIDKLMPLS